MSDLLSALQVGKRALLAQQFGMHVTGDNIANANTPGFSRRRLNLESINLRKFPYGTIGIGVNVESVQRLRERSYDTQIWLENSGLGRWQAEEKYLQQIETVFNDLNGSGLSDSFNEFWNAWLELSNHPQDMGVRSSLVEKTKILTSRFHLIDKQLTDFSTSIGDDIEKKVQQLNDYLEQIAAINRQLCSSQFDQTSHGLKDNRDKLIDEISKLIDVSIVENEDGTVDLYNNSLLLVSGQNAVTINVTEESSGGALVTKLQFSSGSSLDVQNGELLGLLNLRNTLIPAYKSKLNQLAANLVKEVNNLHQSFYALDGSTDNPFFTSDNVLASNIQIDASIEADLSKIAISSDGNPGNNEGALALNGLKEKKLLANNTQTIQEFYNELISDIGTQSWKVTYERENAETLVQSLENQRQSIMGVSLDEEMVNMIKYQNAFVAATRLIGTIDEMMKTVLQMI